jgi:hypothetical protein
MALVFYVSGETKGQMNIVVKRKNFQREETPGIHPNAQLHSVGCFP